MARLASVGSDGVAAVLGDVGFLHFCSLGRSSEDPKPQRACADAFAALVEAGALLQPGDVWDGGNSGGYSNLRHELDEVQRSKAVHRRNASLASEFGSDTQLVLLDVPSPTAPSSQSPLLVCARPPASIHPHPPLLRASCRAARGHGRCCVAAHSATGTPQLKLAAAEARSCSPHRASTV